MLKAKHKALINTKADKGDQIVVLDIHLKKSFKLINNGLYADLHKVSSNKDSGTIKSMINSSPIVSAE